jgi:predicted ABC-type ATPase
MYNCSCFRELLDKNYHRTYSIDRIAFQDKIVEDIISSPDDAGTKQKHQPWVIFTAGPTGVGKSTIIRWLLDRGYLPLTNIVKIDMDEIRLKLIDNDVELSPLEVGDATQEEAGSIAELALLSSLSFNKNVIVDGSMRNINWYRDYLKTLQELFPSIKIAILHVTANTETVIERVRERALKIKRDVPEKRLNETLAITVEKLLPLRSYSSLFVSISNNYSCTAAGTGSCFVESTEIQPFIVYPFFMTWYHY